MQGALSTTRLFTIGYFSGLDMSLHVTGSPSHQPFSADDSDIIPAF